MSQLSMNFIDVISLLLCIVFKNDFTVIFNIVMHLL